jgi:Ca2+-binding RTX toxin-like protein
MSDSMRSLFIKTFVFWFLIGSTLLVVALSAHAAPSCTVMNGTSADDLVYAGNGGHTCIWGLAGDDTVHGGNGSDVVYGGAGSDTLWTGKAGPGDEAYGGRGDDRLHNFGSGQAPGLMDGGPGWDICTGNASDTYISCEVVKMR